MAWSLPDWNWEQEFYGSCSRWRFGPFLSNRGYVRGMLFSLILFLRGMFAKNEMLVLPFYGSGKTDIKGARCMLATALLRHFEMPLQSRAQIRKVSFYDFEPHTYLYGHQFLIFQHYGPHMRPREVFLAFPMLEYVLSSSRNWVDARYKKGWHAELEVLTVRLDARFADTLDMATLKRLENGNLVGREIKKDGKGLLRLVDGKAGIRGEWQGLDLKGNPAKWISESYVWRDVSMR